MVQKLTVAFVCLAAALVIAPMYGVDVVRGEIMYSLSACKPFKLDTVQKLYKEMLILVLIMHNHLY